VADGLRAEKSSRDATIIKFLLGRILLVLLFGHDAVLSSLQGGFWVVIGALLVVSWIAWAFGRAFL
jgi:hypothetical protein